MISLDLNFYLKRQVEKKEENITFRRVIHDQDIL